MVCECVCVLQSSVRAYARCPPLCVCVLQGDGYVRYKQKIRGIFFFLTSENSTYELELFMCRSVKRLATFALIVQVRVSANRQKQVMHKVFTFKFRLS